MFLSGYGPVLLSGTWMTIQLALLSLVLSIIIGLFGASAKLSRIQILRHVATLYTTLIRSVPDLVIMLLLFYIGNFTFLVGVAASAVTVRW